MSKNTAYNSELFKEDLKVFESAIKKKDYKTANIISNRITTNAWVSETQYFGIVGFFLRQLALDVLSASNNNNSSAVDTITKQIFHLTENILAQVSSEKTNLHELWINFNIVKEKSRKDTLPDDEKTYYTTNIEYTHKSVQKVLQLLFESKDIISYGSNNFIKGILNEISRSSRTYGISPEDNYLLSILVMIDRVDEYIGTTSIDIKDFKIRTEKELMPFIEQLEKINSNNTIDETKVNDLIWILIKKWRMYYVQFMEPNRQSIQNQQPIIQGKIRDELIEELAEGIEKEVISE